MNLLEAAKAVIAMVDEDGKRAKWQEYIDLRTAIAAAEREEPVAWCLWSTEVGLLSWAKERRFMESLIAQDDEVILPIGRPSIKLRFSNESLRKKIANDPEDDPLVGGPAPLPAYTPMTDKELADIYVKKSVGRYWAAEGLRAIESAVLARLGVRHD